MPQYSARPQPLLPEFSSPAFSPTTRFNPKSVTEALIAARSAPPKPAHKGPLLHIESHNKQTQKRRGLRNGRCPVSKKAITWARYLSCILRLGQLLGAMGLLVCMLLMRRVDNMTGWICRIPPAVATIHTVYAIYHLSGSYRLKTPGSSKIYLLLASTLDVAIICFYALIAVFSWRQYVQRKNMDWATIFQDTEINVKLVFTVFLTACTAAGLTLITLGMSLYLIHAFRKLENLPPDHNPFVEDDDPQLAVKEKRWTASTGNSETPFLGAAGERRSVPFEATRQKLSPQAFRPPSPAEGRYHYETLNLDSMDLAETRRDIQLLGTGYDQAKPDDDDVVEEDAPRSPVKSSLKRGSRVIRPSSIISLPKRTPTMMKRSSYAPSKSSFIPLDDDDDDSVPIPETQRSSVVSQNSWGGAAVQGYTKAALLQPKQPDHGGWRFRKVSGESR